MNISGRVTLSGTMETLNIRGKSLRNQEGVFTDKTGSIRIVFWEDDIQKVKSKLCYYIKNIAVRKYGDKNYLTLNRQTTIEEIAMTVDRFDDESETAHQHIINLPSDGINYLQRFISCKKCHAKIVDVASTKK